MRVPRFIRRATDPLLSRLRVPVLSGVNRGCWWNVRSAGSGYAAGTRASGQMWLLTALVRPGDVVWDVGAHHGYVTIALARRAGPTGAVHAFEPSAANRQLLARHLRWNCLTDVRVHPFALGAGDGEVCFGGSGTSKTFAVGAGDEVVAVRRADTLVQQGRLPAPTFAKLDVEGAEADVVAGLLPVLSPAARLIVAMHTREADERSTALLQAAGFALVPSAALRRCRDGDWQGDPDLFCAGPAYAGREADLQLLGARGF